MYQAPLRHPVAVSIDTKRERMGNYRRPLKNLDRERSRCCHSSQNPMLQFHPALAAWKSWSATLRCSPSGRPKKSGQKRTGRNFHKQFATIYRRISSFSSSQVLYLQNQTLKRHNRFICFVYYFRFLKWICQPRIYRYFVIQWRTHLRKICADTRYRTRIRHWRNKLCRNVIEIKWPTNVRRIKDVIGSQRDGIPNHHHHRIGIISSIACLVDHTCYEERCRVGGIGRAVAVGINLWISRKPDVECVG